MVTFLQAAKERRENIGVDLYGFQQQLERLHTRLAAAQKSAQELASTRAAAEEQVASLHKAVDADTQVTSNERAQVGHASCHALIQAFLLPGVPTWTHHDMQMEAFRDEVDAVANALKQAEAYSLSQKSEIAITKRCSTQRMPSCMASHRTALRELQHSCPAHCQQTGMMDAASFSSKSPQ